MFKLFRVEKSILKPERTWRKTHQVIGVEAVFPRRKRMIKKNQKSEHLLQLPIEIIQR